MTMARVSILLLLGLLFQLSPASAAETKAEEIKLEYFLVWGTDSEKPDDPRLKDVDPTVRPTLGKFKWKNYWQVAHRPFAVEAGKVNHIVVSKSCELDIKHLDGANFEVKLFGEKKLVATRMKESLAGGRALVLAGDDRNDSAWFVVIRMKNNPSTTKKANEKPSVEASKTNKNSAAESAKKSGESSESAKGGNSSTQSREK